MRLIGADTILAVSQSPRDNPRLLKSVQDAQQGGLGDSREAIDVVQRRDRLLLQGLQNIKSAFETSDRFGAGHWVSQLVVFSRLVMNQKDFPAWNVAFHEVKSFAICVAFARRSEEDENRQAADFLSQGEAL